MRPLRGWCRGLDSLPGAQVYYGNPTCCAWSADGACVAAGGEDDLVTVFSVAEQRVVAWCEGHTSWVTAVRFDPWCVLSALPLCHKEEQFMDPQE